MCEQLMQSGKEDLLADQSSLTSKVQTRAPGQHAKMYMLNVRHPCWGLDCHHNARLTFKGHEVPELLAGAYDISATVHKCILYKTCKTS